MLAFKEVQSIRVEMKGTRGLTGTAYALRPDLIHVMPALMATYVSLKAGEETAVPVAVPDLPANADVKAITARLYVSEGDPGPAPPPNSVTVIRDKDATTLQVALSAPTRPRNVTVRLDKGETIWMFSDTLVKNEYELPDFSAQTNAYLDKLKPSDGQVTLNFLVKSDTTGQVRIVVSPTDVTRLQTQTWTNELDQTVRVDRNLELDFGDRRVIPLDAIFDDSRTLLTGLRLDAGGSFGPERLLGAVFEHGGDDYATVSRDYAIAQHIVLETDVQATGISGLIACDTETELYVELQTDQWGTPGGDAPLGKSNVTISPGENGSASWTYAQFEAPVPLASGVPYWIVIKSVHGAARLGIERATAGYLRSVLVNRTGRLWKPFAPPASPPIASMVRVVYVPSVDNHCAAIQIAVRGAAPQAVDPQQTPMTISFPLRETSISTAVLEITSHARGALTIANVIQEY